MTENKQAVSEKSPETAGKPEVWHPFNSLRRQVDQLFDEFSPTAWHFPFRLSAATPVDKWWATVSPESAMSPVDITEDDAAYKLSIELPGLEEKDVQISVSNGYLVVSGEKKEEKEEKEKGRYLSERRYGRFQRSFAVPDHVDVAKVDAVMKNGVLSLVLPKTAESKRDEVKIPVRKG